MTKERFKAIRLYLSMTQAQFAEFLDISVSAVGMIEAGHREVSGNVSAKLARKFQATDEFIEYLENRKRLVD
jgi:DNA-binding XRE family transcriptional regulator